MTMISYNQNPEQVSRDTIDMQLRAAGWVVQDKASINLHAGQGQAVREYPTDTDPADYILFIGGRPIGVIEAKKEALGYKLTETEDQTSGYAHAKLKWVTKNDQLPFLDGHRSRQDLYGHHVDLPPAQAWQGQAHPVSGRYPQPWRAGRAGIHGKCSQQFAL